MRSLRECWAVGVVLVVVGLGTGCAVGPYTWVDDLPEHALRPSAEYRLAPGDVVNVSVLNQENLSGKVTVRDDGEISLPLVNDVPAAGMSVKALQAALAQAYSKYVQAPVVAVALAEARPFQVSVLGEVAHPGVYTLPPRCGVLNALAAAGGTSEFAHKDRIFVVRNGDHPERIRFTFDKLSRADLKALEFRLERGDTLVVE